ncbi:MAG: L-glyceraldehyde 3-phosphate reductase [Sphaerochaeta sp.]|uniref:L-glyceraldehyde 3-phosphate reductase n=1 Tax=Sphaerochaeta sp. TaxID=1972642 RepID=UPI002978EAF0|nr:L-glyceraldehyde 3-phosphate reductase [Sphaerochaeta sp.]MDD3928403.1 L-glyceraldehyde 3-phosphate reductase [Sphaerochaeta sp.]
MYKPNPERYDSMLYNRCGKSGLKLPAISLGLWHNYGDTTSLANSRKMLHTAFDLGITHFDLANNYGPPPGSAELNFGKLLAQDFAAYRDELIISTKAGYRMWPGIYGEWGSRKYVLASLDQSLKRMGLDYVDIFYSHRFDPDTPLEETMGALASAYKAGKCLYVGISSYSAAKTKAAYEILASMDVPLLIHQPSYSMLNRWVEESLLDTLNTLGVGTICFSPLAQGMLSDRYLKEIPEGSRAAKSGSSLSQELLTEQNLKNIRSLNEIALSRGQSLPQMALAWCLRRKEITSVLIGASSPEQIVENVGSLQNLSFSQEELAAIDSYAKEGGINLWARSSKD